MRKKSIGERLREVRGERSQADFAKLLGIGRTTLIRYEADERKIDADLMLKLNLLFGVEPLWLVTGQAPNQLTPREQALLDNYRHSDALGKKAVEATASALAKKEGVQPDSS